MEWLTILALAALAGVLFNGFIAWVCRQIWAHLDIDDDIYPE